MTKTAAPMTSGSIWKQMTFFAMPIFLGNLFQQLYNTVDSLIVGNFLGSSALAAVSSLPGFLVQEMRKICSARYTPQSHLVWWREF